MDRLVPLRPLRPTEVLDGAFRLVRANPSQLVLLTLLTLGLLTLLQQLALPATLAADTTASPEELFDATLGALFGIGVAVSLLLQLVITPAVNGALTAMGIATDRGEDDSWRAGLRHGTRRFWRLLGTAVLSSLALGAAFLVGAVVVALVVVAASQVAAWLAVLVGVVLGLALLLGGVVLYAMLNVAIPVVVVEEAGPVRALRRSVRLLAPRALPTAGTVVLAGLLVGIVATVMGLVAAPFGLVSPTVGAAVTGVMGALATAVTTPFAAFVALLLYTDARVRQEGLDVAVLAAELDVR